MSGLVFESFFARWIRQNGQISAIHWFRDGEPVCGSACSPQGDLILPDEPILSCTKCIAAIKKRDGLS